MKLFIQKLRYTSKFVGDLKDCVPGPWEILGTPRRKTTGVWFQMKVADGQIMTLDSGQVAVKHNELIAAGLPGLFTISTATVEGQEYEMRTDALIGIKDGELEVA